MEKWWPKIRVGGRMCGDDAQSPGVRKLVNALLDPEEARVVWGLAYGHWCAIRQ